VLDAEAKAMREISIAADPLTRHHERPTTRNLQLLFDFNEDERRQKSMTAVTGRHGSAKFIGELETEPERIRALYEVKPPRRTHRLVYLWPVTN